MRKVFYRFISTFCVLLVSGFAYGQNAILKYDVEAGTILGGGDKAPFWLTTNRYGKYSTLPQSAFASAGIVYRQKMNYGWRFNVGAEIAGSTGMYNNIFAQQGFAEVAWKKIGLSFGSKEREAFLNEDRRISSGAMLEGWNARPFPQLRIEVPEYLTVPFTKNWLHLKGYFAYGWLVDGEWQRDFVSPGRNFVDNILYHGKGLLFKIGNQEKKRWELEVGLQVTTMFGGTRYKKLNDGGVEKLFEMPSSFKDYLSVILPMAGGDDTPNSDQLNVEGNVMGAWLGSFAYRFENDSRLRVYADHFFEDESQMFMQYGLWKDGFIGVEYTFPKGLWIEKILWEGVNTTDQSGPIGYEWFDASFEGIQISACDNYYNHGFYGAWQYYGQAMGHPLVLSPIYNENGSITFRSNRMKAHHIGVCGSIGTDWDYTVKGSWTRNWGTYNSPTDDVLHQVCLMGGVSYMPAWAKGWKASVEAGVDIGKYPGNAAGVMITLKKEGVIWKK